MNNIKKLINVRNSCFRLPWRLATMSLRWRVRRPALFAVVWPPSTYVLGQPNVSGLVLCPNNRLVHSTPFLWRARYFFSQGQARLVLAKSVRPERVSLASVVNSLGSSPIPNSRSLWSHPLCEQTVSLSVAQALEE